LSRLSSVGSSAQSAESAPVRSRSFNALNRATNSSPRSSGAGRIRAVLTDERSDIRRVVEDVAASSRPIRVRHFDDAPTALRPRGIGRRDSDVASRGLGAPGPAHWG
jgi:hypothetical protein